MTLTTSNNTYKIFWGDRCPSVIVNHFGTENILTDTSSLSKENYFILNQVKGILILCELNRNEKNEPVKMQELYGIELAKKFRREGITTPIIFTSFLSCKQILSIKPDAQIITSIGHTLVQLPVNPEILVEKSYKTPNLTPIELRDVQLFSCNNDGILNEKLHQLSGVVNTLSAYGPEKAKEELVQIIKEIYYLFSQSADDALEDFRNKYPFINSKNVNDAIGFIKNRGEKLRKSYSERNDSNSKIAFEKRPWQLLVLDDVLNEQSPLIKLLKEQVQSVICTSTANDALNKLKKEDTLRGKIPIILTDYRLLKEIDGIKMQQNVQGYTFLQEIGDTFQSKILGALIYSGLPRQFLLETSRSLKIRSEIYSKLDFRLDDIKARDYLVSRIIEIGDECYLAMLALPRGNKVWGESIEKHYIDYRNLKDYETRENDICKFCKNWVDEFLKNKNPPTPISFTEMPTNLKDFSDKTTWEKFDQIFKTRRLAQYLYLYYGNKNTNKILKVIGEDHLRPASKKDVKDKTFNSFFSQALGLNLSEFPFGATIEELNWFHYDLNIPVLDSYKKFRGKLNESEELIGNFIYEIAALKSIIKENEYRYITKPQKGETSEDHRVLVFNEQTFNPYFFDKMDMGFCIDFLDLKKECFNMEATKEYRVLINNLRNLWRWRSEEIQGK